MFISIIGSREYIANAKEMQFLLNINNISYVVNYEDNHIGIMMNNDNYLIHIKNAESIERFMSAIKNHN